MTFIITTFIAFLVIGIIRYYSKFVWGTIRIVTGLLWKLAMVFGALIALSYLLAAIGL